MSREVSEGKSDGAVRTVCCASDGNHGRAVAWAAGNLGYRAVVYLPGAAPLHRARRIQDLGAVVVRVDGRYDDAVERASLAAAERGWLLVADTSEEADDPTVRDVMAGYGVLGREVIAALAGGEPLTHVFLQAGVGGVAAATIAAFVHAFGTKSPRFVLVEPAAAACVLESLSRGRCAELAGDLTTVMDCLSAGWPSAAAWPILKSWVAGAVAVEDGWTSTVVERLGRGDWGDPPLDVGPSGAAGIAGLWAVAKRPDLAEALSLGPRSHVLVVATEEGCP